MKTNDNKPVEQVSKRKRISVQYGESEDNVMPLEEKNAWYKKNWMSITCVSLQLIVSICFFTILIIIDMFPVRYLVVMGVILSVLLGFTILSQFSKAGRKVGWFFSAIIMILFLFASIYIWKAHDVIDEVTGMKETVTKSNDVSIVVMANSPYNGLEDLKGKTFGIQNIIDRQNTDSTLRELEFKFQEHLDTIEYESWKSQVQALYNNDIDAIIINEAYRSLIEEDFENFNQETKVIDGFKYVEEVKQNSSKPDIKVDTEPFNVYLSGNDSYGTISLDAGRADVNIIATVNPKTKQILLTTTPRDFYVELPIYGGGYYDKLTHAGMLGFDTSIETLEKLYQIEIDYYIRLNFSGFRDIVDALDGVEVYSEYEFVSVKGVYFQQGKNYLNGKEALAFVRERKAFSDGDFQRGKNQMAMIEAMADKIFSPTILMNYMDLMNSVSSCFLTDIPREKINDLVKMQLNDGAQWTIISNSVMGYGNARTGYVGGNEPLSCVDPDVGDVALATELIRKCMNGEKVVIPDKEKEGIYQGSNLGGIGLGYLKDNESSNVMESEISSSDSEAESDNDSYVESEPIISDVDQSSVITDENQSQESSAEIESSVIMPELESSIETEDSIQTEESVQSSYPSEDSMENSEESSTDEEAENDNSTEIVE